MGCAAGDDTIRVLLSAIHYPVAAARYVFWALRRMGHTVITAGPSAGPYLPWANGHNLEPFEWKPDIALSQDGRNAVLSPLQSALAHLETPPDLIIQMDAHFIMSGKAPCPNVLWAIDNHVAEYDSYDEFDRIFIAHSWGYMHDLKHAEWLPCAHDPQHHYVTEEGAERTIPALMIGSGYRGRQDLIGALREAGMSVGAMTGLVYDAYNAMYNQARVALVFSIRGDLAMRVFENMAQGCIVVADRGRDLERVGLVDGVHYLGYSSLAEAVAQVKFALATYDTAGQTMIRAAREFVAAHTWQARVEHILKAVNLAG